MPVSDDNINSALRVTSRISSIVLHVQLVGLDKCSADEAATQVGVFRANCATQIRKHHGMTIGLSDDSILGVFPVMRNVCAELMATNAAHEIRSQLMELRKNEGYKIVMKGSINGGEVVFGNATFAGESTVMGSAVSASYQLLDTVQPMQITLTRKVREVISDKYQTIARRAVEIGTKYVSLFYLHLKK